ncbi:hypothetical protein ACHGLA_32165 [Streptomyces sp. YH02]|uniref:hypothetical protein n=1 Tax=Streptomyces sp. YH02 TaxID=3256999 RepID=UPI0037575751
MCTKERQGRGGEPGVVGSSRRRLDAALDGLAVTFRGMTAHPDETNCTCHWGSAEDLARLKVADVELDPDLLRRTWQATDWTDKASVLRRILPQFASTLVSGIVTSLYDMERAGLAFALGNWQEWPAEQAAAVEEFLRAWWAYTLTEADPPVPAHDLLVLIAEASGTLSPWLDAWEALSGPVADGHLAAAADRWEYDLLGDQLPWSAWEDEEGMRAELTAWLVRHAPARLRAHGAPEDLLHRIRLLGVTGPDRWEDPHWPGHRY